MFRNRSVDVHSFAMVPRAEIPRSAFNRQTAYKTTFNAGYLVPFYLDEVLPGDSFTVSATAFIRMATPVFPVLDNLHLETFYFFVPCRLIWSNWKKFMGEQANPADSISFAIPIASSPNGGYAVGSLQDYMGLQTVGQIGGGSHFNHNNLPMRAYNLIWNEWFRDENLQNSAVVDLGDGPDTVANYVLLKRGKRKDYITGCLPWPQKGATAVSLPLGTSAPVVRDGAGNRPQFVLDGSDRTIQATVQGAAPNLVGYSGATTLVSPADLIWSATAGATGLKADLSTATAATINQIRQAFQIQKLLERDARGGTRYTEIIRAHFGVVSPDARLQRPEYLGGGSSIINVSPVAQTSGTGAAGTSAPLGTLAAIGQAVASNHGFRQSFTEHGYVIGLVNIRADLSYQQGMRKLWNRSTRYDFYFPAFAMLGEQAVLNNEVYQDGSGNDNAVFGYQERWGEYRYFPSMITGMFKSTAASSIDPWHFSQKFTGLPTLGATFVQDATDAILDRNLSAGASARTGNQQFLMDALIQIKSVRPLPMFSVPGLIDHF